MSSSLRHPLKPTSDRHNSSAQTPAVNSALTTPETNSAISHELCRLARFSPMLTGHCNSWQWRWITNRSGVLFPPCHLFVHRMLHKSTETSILPSLLRKLEVDDINIRNGLGIHVSVQRWGPSIPFPGRGSCDCSSSKSVSRLSEISRLNVQERWQLFPWIYRWYIRQMRHTRRNI